VVVVVAVVVEEVRRASSTPEAHSLAVPCAVARVGCTAPMVAGTAAGGGAAGAHHNNPWSQTDARS
jgi:hypothetical protein